MVWEAAVKFFKWAKGVYEGSKALQAITTVLQITSLVVGVKGFLQARQMLAKGQDILANKTSAGGKIPVIYGTRRVGAQIIYMDVSNNDSRHLFVVYALSVGECDEILGRTIELDGNPITDPKRFRYGCYVGSDRNGETGYSGHRALNTVSQIGSTISAGAGGFGTSSTSRYRITFNLHHGEPTQSADPMLVASMPNWTSSHKLNGVCYISAHYKFDKEGMFAGVPQLTVQVKGKRVYDPRDNTQTFGTPSTYKHSSNPALCFLDLITNNEYGKGLTASQLNMSTFSSAANVCDTKVDQPYFNGTAQSVTWSANSGDNFFTITGTGANDIWWQNKVDEVISIYDQNGDGVLTNAEITDIQRTNFFDTNQEFVIFINDYFSSNYSSVGGSTLLKVKRFHCNGYLDTNKNVMDNAKELLANMRGVFLYVDGQYELQIEDTGTSTFTITDDHIISDAGISVDYGNKDKKANKVIVEFFNANKKYELDTATVLHDASPQYYSDDGDEILEIKAEFPYVTDPYIAYNMAKAILTRSRNQTTMQFLGTPEMYKLNVGDIVTLSYTPLGFTGKISRVEALELQPNGLVAVSLIEYFDVYTWEVPPQEPVEEQSNPPSAYAVKAPTGLSFTDSDSSATGRPILSWNAPTDYPDYEFRVNVVDSSGNQLMNKIVNTNEAELNFTPTGNNYVASITSLNTLGTESDPVTLTFNVTTEPVAEGDIRANAITANKIDVNELSAISADMGTITAGSIDIGSGAFSVTSAGVLDATGATIGGSFSAGSGNSIFKADSDGIYLGNATFANAPFKVLNTGAVQTTLSFTAGVAGTDAVAKMSGSGDYRFWSGNETPANASFSVDKDGKAVARNLVLKLTDGTVYFDSETGFSSSAISQISAVTGTKVNTISSTFDADTEYEEITVTANTTVNLSVSIDTNFGGTYGSSTENTAIDEAEAKVPENFTLTIEHSSDGGSSYSTVVTDTFTRVNDRANPKTTPASDEYKINTFTDRIYISQGGGVIHLATTTTSFNLGCVDSDGRTVLSYTGLSLTGTTSGTAHRIRATVSTTDTSYDSTNNNVSSTAPRVVSVTDPSGNGFYVDDGSGSTVPPEGDITRVQITTAASSGLTGGANYTSGDALFTLALASSIDGAKTFTNNVVIQGDLDVQGTTTTIDTTNLDVKDKNITLNYSTGDSSANANGAGITIQDAVNSSTDATLTWNTSDDSFNFSHDLNVGTFTSTGTTSLNLKAEGQHNTTLGLFEDNANYGFSLNYDGGLNDFIIRRHDNSASGVDVLTLNRENNNATFAGTISSGVITSTGASSGRYTGLEVVNSTNAGGTETAIGLGVISASNSACDVKLVANRVGANSGSDFYIEQTDSSGSQQETFRITESGDASFAGNVTATAFYGDGSNLTGVSSTTINNNADNRIITGSGTANTLNAESTLTYDGTTLKNDRANGSGSVVGIQLTSGSSIGDNISLDFGSTDANEFSFVFDHYSSRLSLLDDGSQVFYVSGGVVRFINAPVFAGGLTLAALSVTGNGTIQTGAAGLIKGGYYQVGSTTVIDTSRNLTNIGTISAAAITTSAANQDINMDASANGQLEIDGNGYSGAIALNGSAMHIYNNSSTRSLVLGTNETARLTIGGTGGFNFHSNNLTSVGTINSGSITVDPSGTYGDGITVNAGDNLSATNGAKQIIMSFGGTSPIDYAHTIRTRHNSGADTGNTVEVYLWDYGTDSSSTIGTKRALVLENSTGLDLLTGGYKVGGTTVIDSSRNLTNIGTGNFAGDVTLSGGSGKLIYTGMGSLLHANVSGFTSVPQHDLLYWGWTSGTSDYIYLKAGGNSTGTHGTLVVADGGLFYGVWDNETGAITSSSTNPITTTRFRVDNSGNGTFAGTISSGAITSSDSITLENGGLILGEDAYSASSQYVGMKSALMTGANDYMIISAQSTSGDTGHTYVSAKDGQTVHIRGGGNNSSNQIVVPDGSFISMETSNLRFNGNLQSGTTTVIDSSRNLTNITSETITGTLNEALNFSAATTNDARGISFNARTALTADSSDGWLRLNQNSEFSNGVYTPANFRSDGNVRGANFSVGTTTVIDSSRNLTNIGTGNFSGNVVVNAGSSYPLQVSSTQRYQLQIRNPNNTTHSSYGWWLAHDTNFNFAVHADGAGDRFTLTRDGNATFTGDVTVGSGILTVKATGYGGGQIGLGDWSNSNPIGISEGLWDTVTTDNDFITIYSRNSFNIRGYLSGSTTAHWLSLTSSDLNLVQSQSLQMGGTTVIDSSRNLTNIVNITSSGQFKTNYTTFAPSPNTYVYLSASELQFGGNNNGKESNSAQISAGQHVANSLNFVGMSSGTTSSTRRMDFWVEGKAYFRGDVVATGNVTAYGSASDKRLKKDIVKIDNAIDKIKSVSGYEFAWNENAPEDKQDKREFGVIAQEVEEAGLDKLVFEYERPVSGTDEDNKDLPDEKWKAVHYDKFVPILIEAIKEQQQQIDELKARLDNDS